MRCITGLLSLSIAAAATAQNAPPIAKYVPPAPHVEHVFVFDSAHVLSAQASAALQDSAHSLQGETGADVVWVTLPTLGGRPIEEAALYIGRTWRVGSAGKPGDPLRNRGLVILYIPDKTKTAGPNFRIEVGNGLEGTITDSRSRTITAAMREDLRAKRYDEAYLAGWNVAARLVREDFAASRANAAVAPATALAPPAPEPRSAAAQFASVAIVGITLIGIILLVVFVARQQRNTAGAPLASRRRRKLDTYVPDWTPSAPSADYSSSSSSDSSSSSSGGDVGGGGGFSGGGSSDTI
jgi:uncharacterized protein